MSLLKDIIGNPFILLMFVVIATIAGFAGGYACAIQCFKKAMRLCFRSGISIHSDLPDGKYQLHLQFPRPNGNELSLVEHCPERGLKNEFLLRRFYIVAQLREDAKLPSQFIVEEKKFRGIFFDINDY